MIRYLAAVSLVSFALYGIDKYKARRGLWRIPEAVLLFAAELYLRRRIRRITAADNTRNTGKENPSSFFFPLHAQNETPIT